jgi:hypothetical protein
LLIALIANLFVLPWVIETQQRNLGAFKRLPFLNHLPWLTKLAYRVLMPILFAVVGWIGATRLFGGTL